MLIMRVLFKVRLMCHTLMEKLSRRYVQRYTTAITKTARRKREGREEGGKERNRRILKYLRFVLKRMRGRHDLDPFNYALHWPPSVKAGAVCSPVLVSSGVSTIHLIKPQ